MEMLSLNPLGSDFQKFAPEVKIKSPPEGQACLGMRYPMKLHSTLTRITAAAVMSTFVPAVTLTSVFAPVSAVAAKPTTNSATMLVQGTSNQGNFVGSLTIKS